MMASLVACDAVFINGVLMRPGAMALTVMP